MKPHRRSTTACASAALALLGASASACFTGSSGREPSPDELYFPTGLVTSPGRTTLYVTNSDFDLRYSAGSVQALDLAALRGATRPIVDALAAAPDDVVAACGAAGRGLNDDDWLTPGPCSPFELPPLVRAYAFIGAFASGALLVHAPDDEHARLFVPVRGDPSITYFEVEDDRAAAGGAAFAPSFRLDCGAEEDGKCAAAFRIGQDPEQALRGIRLPADPVGIAASDDGSVIVTAHQTTASASLLMNDWHDPSPPWLAYFASGLPVGPMELASIPAPALAAAAGPDFGYGASFALTYRSSAEVDVLRFNPDSGSVPPRPFVQRIGATLVGTNASGVDSRGIGIVADRRQACEASCAANDLACLEHCAEEVPLEVFVANRTPPSLVLGQFDSVLGHSGAVASSAFDALTLYDAVPLATGVSRVRVGKVIDADGALATRVFAVCFDSRAVYSFDPVLGRVDAVIRTGRGPHDLAFDWGEVGGEPYAQVYVAHFTDSYLGVVDLDMRHGATFGLMYATVGVPRPPEESN
ncbi:MAG: hypothetical protein IT373_15775 [Polyangiaceae bacterium]|nr:hypothetical protein [Polyangiaceae bacterium]